MRGQTYSAIQVILPIWHSAGVKFADAKGNVDFDSRRLSTSRRSGPACSPRTSRHPAVNDGYRELYALMEKGKCGLWFYGPHASPALMTALGDAIQGAPNPRVGPNRYMLANPEGPMMVSTCKEKDAPGTSSGSSRPVTPLAYTVNRAVPPVRKSLAQNAFFQNNRFIKMSLDASDQWWTPPYEHKHWTNFQDKIPPYWQEVLREKITPAQFNQIGAKLLRGQS
jgi:hypothetical protein